MQRLDGPVRGNGKIIQELEGAFRGAGWNVIKVIWGSDWDAIFDKDENNLIELSNNIISSSDDNKKINNEMFIEQIEQILYDEKSFYEMFDFINNSASIIMSEDKKIKIISWFLPLKDGHEFFCFIQEIIDKDYNFFFYKSGEINENYQKKFDLYKTKTIKIIMF